MPQIGGYQQRTSVSGAAPAVRTHEGTGMIAFGNAVQSASRDIAVARAHAREQDAALWVTKSLSETQTKWTQHLIERREAAAEGAPDFTGSLLKDFDSYSDELAARAPTTTSRATVRERLLAQRAALAQSAMAFEAEERRSYTESVVELSANAGRAEAFQQPDRYAELLRERFMLIDEMRLPPERKRQIKTDMQYRMAEAAVSGIAEADPTTAINLLRMPAGRAGVLAVDVLSAEDRRNIMEAAERQRIANEEQSYRASNRIETDVQDTTSKTGDRLLAEGALTPRWIEDNRERLSAEDFRYFYGKVMAAEDPQDEPADPMTYADLRARVSAGEDVRTDARTALQQGKIRTTDYDRLLGEVESSRPGWYKQGVEYISTSAGVSDLNPDPAAAQRKAAMLDDWAQWADANPKATGEQARAEYQRTVTEYAIVDYEKMSLMMRSPRYLVGGRNQPNFDATAAATVQALQNGELNQTEFDAQAALIAQWEDAWQRAQTK